MSDHYYGCVIVYHCEGNPHIVSGYSKSTDRLAKWLRKQASDYVNRGYCYPYERVTLKIESMSNPAIGFTMDLAL